MHMEKAKKILLITLEYPPAHGGVASYYAGLVGELTRQGHEVDVILNTGTHWHNPSSPPLTLRGGKNLLLSKWFWPRWLRGYFTVRAAVKREKPDMLFVGQVLPLGTVAYLLRKHISYVVFTHGMDVLTAQKSWRKRWLVKRILAHAKFVVANSEFTKKQLEVSGVSRLSMPRYLAECEACRC
jgi:glycosyltransferase involved in cell wall biosynthesis